jgi:hypothetical protein
MTGLVVNISKVLTTQSLLEMTTTSKSRPSSLYLPMATEGACATRRPMTMVQPLLQPLVSEDLTGATLTAIIVRHQLQLPVGILTLSTTTRVGLSVIIIITKVALRQVLCIRLLILTGECYTNVAEA